MGSAGYTARLSSCPYMPPLVVGVASSAMGVALGGQRYSSSVGLGGYKADTDESELMLQA